mgnify:FL=1
MSSEVSDMKELILGTNLKMFMNFAQTRSYISRLNELTGKLNHEQLRLFVIPSFTAIPGIRTMHETIKIEIGAQNMHWEEQGEYTGEVSPRMLEEFGISIVEIGHSERRHKFGETNEMIQHKVDAAIKHGFTALLCVGETAFDKENGVSDEVLSMQIKIGLKNVLKENVEKLLVAYEPVWAIGMAGEVAAPDYVAARMVSIRKAIQTLFPGCMVPVLFGGSVNETNAQLYLEQSRVDGLFIGRAAWDADRFYNIITQLMKE